jgi:hypothetical protein
MWLTGRLVPDHKTVPISAGTFQGNARYGNVNAGPWLNAEPRAILRPDELMGLGNRFSRAFFFG